MTGFKRVGAAALGAVMILTAAAPGGVAEASTKSDKVLKKKADSVAVDCAVSGNIDPVTYGLYDIDSDGTKELFVLYGENDVTCRIFRYDAGTNKAKAVKTLKEVNFVKKSGKGKLVVTSGQISDTEKITYYTYKGDTLRSTAVYTYNTAKSVYKKNGKKISAAAYNKVQKSADGLKAVSIGKYSKEGETARQSTIIGLQFEQLLQQASLSGVFAEGAPNNGYNVRLEKYDPKSGEYEFTDGYTVARGDLPTKALLGKFDLYNMALLDTEEYVSGHWGTEEIIAVTNLRPSNAGTVLDGFEYPANTSSGDVDPMGYELKGEYTFSDMSDLSKAEFFYRARSVDGSAPGEWIPIARYLFGRM